MVVHGKEWRVYGVVVHGKLMESAWERMKSAWCGSAW